ncbi:MULTISPECIES: hypothetical protein [unclassified Rhodanobacter]|nr:MULTISPECIES: hypothetical protein [unclassified Rhodanobacter]MBT2145116.1 hypothetical protein [Rhodanobacter sp. LX-99]MBT2149161.1 hypothetical protein [Rhodanobacter sp. LX-100]
MPDKGLFVRARFACMPVDEDFPGLCGDRLLRNLPKGVATRVRGAG